MASSNYGKINYYISCNMGWMFHMNNLKSLYETGLKLADYRGLLAAGQARERHDLHQEFRDISGRLDEILAITLAKADDR